MVDQQPTSARTAFEMDPLAHEAAQNMEKPDFRQLSKRARFVARGRYEYTFVQEDPGEDYVVETSPGSRAAANPCAANQPDRPTPSNPITAVTTPDGSQVLPNSALTKPRRAKAKAVRGIKKEPPKRPTTQCFRKNKPLKTELHDDAWLLIFEYCPPRTLAAFRASSRRFASILHSQAAVWVISRTNTYGQCPPCPSVFSEMRYSILLGGHGCETPGCNDSKCRKTYWLLGGRFCKKCVKKRMRLEADLQSAWGHYPLIHRVLACLPYCSVDSWNIYRGMGEYRTVSPRAYDMDAFLKTHRKAEEMCANEPSDVIQQTWFQEMKEKSLALMEEFATLEDFVKEVLEPLRLEEAKENRDHRYDFLLTRAVQELSIPQSRIVMMEAFKSSVASPRPPTENNWFILKPKLIAEMQYMDQVSGGKKNTEQRKRSQKIDSRIDYDNDPVPVVKLLCELADRVIKELAKEKCRDPDNLHIVFCHKLRKLYEESTDERKEILYLSDCFRVVREKLEPYVRRESCSHYGASATFRCPACTKSRTERGFRETLEHIFHTHTRNDYADFRKWQVCLGQLDEDVWSMEWPMNLPLLRKDQISTGRWNLDARRELEPREPFPVYTFNPFDGRGVTVDRIRSFAEDVTYVLDALEDCRLNDKFKAMIAFKFALRKHIAIVHRKDREASTFQPSEVDSDDETRPVDDPLDNEELFVSLPEFETARLLQHELFLSGHTEFGLFRCDICFNAPGTQHARGTRRRLKLKDLISHYHEMSHNPAGWSLFMFSFPAPRELAIQLHGDEQSRRLFHRLFPRSSDKELLRIYKIIERAQPIDDDLKESAKSTMKDDSEDDELEDLSESEVDLSQLEDMGIMDSNMDVDTDELESED